MRSVLQLLMFGSELSSLLDFKTHASGFTREPRFSSTVGGFRSRWFEGYRVSTNLPHGCPDLRPLSFSILQTVTQRVGGPGDGVGTPGWLQNVCGDLAERERHRPEHLPLLARFSRGCLLVSGFFDKHLSARCL